VFVNRQENEKLIKRLATDGSYILQSAMSYRSIAFTLQFILNHVANLGIIPDDLFSAYDQSSNGRSRHYRLDNQTPSTNSPNIQQSLTSGLWQIVKLVIDSSISDRRVADSSISQPDGSLLNQIRKVCQQPFVEFFTDTYGDQFYFVVRKPPFDGESIIKALNNIVNTQSFDDIEEGGSISKQISTVDIVYSIKSEDVISMEFSDNDNDVYSIFELKPQGLFAGQGSEVSLAYIPLIYFAPYADIWGAKRLSVVSNYLPYSGLVGSQTATGTNFIVEQCAIDLKYLIDCYSYMPFTRNATIVVNGDRTIKYGTWIRLEHSGEIGYVTQVQNSFSVNNNTIDRTTTIQLTRVMVEKYCKSGYTENDISYFNIIDTELIYQYIVSSLSQNNVKNEKLGVQIRQNFAVNQKVFDFFIKRNQFKK
jgi:hypothetical protein